VTNLAVDAVVNAANSRLVAGGGICGAIFDKADEWKLSKACKRSRQLHGPCPPGQARLTRGYSLPAPFVIHAVGPMDQDENDLAAAYWSTLDQCAHPQPRGGGMRTAHVRLMHTCSG
jgi:O-acetyl-ADP-ribose deacetylase (regulator of RNase III)